MRTLRVVAALALVLALAAGAGAGVAAADHDTSNDNCGGLHTAEERTAGTPAEERVAHNHHECHENENWT